MRIPFTAPRDVTVPTRAHWHEGTKLLGYWNGSYLFRGNDGHVLCVSSGFIRDIAAGTVTREVRKVEP